MAESNFAELLENEWYIVRYSGEIPEIAYNSAVYFLTRAKDGPRQELSEEQITFLQKAAMDRYREIVLRDLYHENHGSNIYRGVKRSMENYQRMCRFCSRQGLRDDDIRLETGHQLLLFLRREIEEVVRKGSRTSIINCSREDLYRFVSDLEVEPGPEIREKLDLLFSS
ncbi:hypothetical protein [Desulfomarina sp.]